MFHSETVPITGVDLDHCANPDGSIDAWAKAILRSLNSYAEYSPSGAGIHVYVQGTVSHGFHKKVPGAPHEQAAMETYSTGRYFTVTGQHVPGTPTTLEDGASTLAVLYERFTTPQPTKNVQQQKGIVNLVKMVEIIMGKMPENGVSSLLSRSYIPL